MKSSSVVLLFLILALVAGCGGGGGGGSDAAPLPSPAPSPSPPPAPHGDNVLQITVNGSLCSVNSYLNKPCVSVTICTPGTSNCQTVTDILLDTGDYGLRMFNQVLTVPLAQVTSGIGALTECVQYGDGSSAWGPVKMASVILGNEAPVLVPIQVIDATFGALPGVCQNAYQSPADAGYNGSLGVGLFLQDCGSFCTTHATSQVYYTCNGSNCTGTAVPLSDQVQNPVALLPSDNNGVTIQLPGVPPGGAPSVNGYLVLGIGTQSNNAPSAVTPYLADQYGNFVTVFNGVSYSSFIDIGSNGLFFRSPPGSLLPNCPSPDAAWFCPASTVSLSATNASVTGSPSGVISFQIANFDSLITTSNAVFADIGGYMPNGFDWGLPFFLGRNVSIGIEGRTSSLGSGPYWAY